MSALNRLVEEGMTSMEIGDVVSFGRYPFGADGSEGLLQWVAIAHENDATLLLTKDCIDCVPFCSDMDAFEECYWSGSFVRAWLNNVFLESFSEGERERILPVEHIDEGNEYLCALSWGGCKAVTDLVFLLSEREVNEYLGSSDLLVARCTPYARKVFLKYDGGLDDGEGTCGWWTRTSGFMKWDGATSQYASGVVEIFDDLEYELAESARGARYPSDGVDEKCVGVRPAIWLRG